MCVLVPFYVFENSARVEEKSSIFFKAIDKFFLLFKRVAISIVVSTIAVDYLV